MIHQLTDLPYALEASKMADALERNARLRDEGTRNLVAAAVHSGARRMIAQSIAFIYAEGPLPHREEDPLLPVSTVISTCSSGISSRNRERSFQPDSPKSIRRAACVR